jgi:hypothetical protein
MFFKNQKLEAKFLGKDAASNKKGKILDNFLFEKLCSV